MLNTPSDLIPKRTLNSLTPVHSIYEPGRYCGNYWFCTCGRPITNHMEDVDGYEASL